MANYYIGADRCDVGEAKDMNTIAAKLRSFGHSVEVGGVGPNQEGAAHSVSKDKTFLFLVCGVAPATIWSFKVAIESGSIPKTIFIHSGWTSTNSSSPMHSEQGMLNYEFSPEWDSGQFMSSSSVSAMASDSGKVTVGEYCKKNSNYVGVVWASSPEEAAQKIHNGQVVGYGGSGTYEGGNGGTGSSSSGTSNTSPLLSGEMTFEELVGEICNGIDLMFLCKRSTVVVTDFETIFAEAKYLRDKYHDSVKSEQVNLWQMEEDSYELNINQHGFYNTVYVEYKNGKVKESFDDLVRVYGEVPITYKDKGVDKSTAVMKAKAYLAAHLRDLEMSVNTTMLADADIDIGDIISIENPMTMVNKNKTSQGIDPEFLFTKGINTSWEGDEYISADLECQFSPTSPKRLEVPTAGSTTSSTSSSDSGSSSSSTGTFNSCGVSSDGKKLCAIGKPSAAGESHYGYTLYRSIFVRKCPFCGSDELYWGYMWDGNFPCTKKHNNGSDGRYEGHIYCDGCDADFSCIDGADHISPPRAYLKRADSGPVKATESDAASLKAGTYSV